MRLRYGLAAVLLVCASAGAVQAQTITSYRLDIFIQGASSPVTSAVLPMSSFICGQARTVVSGNVANPTRILIEDPVIPTLDCFYSDNGTGPLLGLPFNPTTVYTAALAATNSVGTSAATMSVNSFTRPGSAPTAPRQVRVGE